MADNFSVFTPEEYAFFRQYLLNGSFLDINHMGGCYLFFRRPGSNYSFTHAAEYMNDESTVWIPGIDLYFGLLSNDTTDYSKWVDILNEGLSKINSKTKYKFVSYEIDKGFRYINVEKTE